MGLERSLGHVKRVQGGDIPRGFNCEGAMPEEPTGVENRKRILQQVLLAYLEVSTVFFWPGGDGLTREDVLLNYLPAAAAGRVPGLEELLTRYPELADELKAFFSTPDRLNPRYPR